MFRNILAATLRNLARNGLYSAISIFGLAIGICAALLASLVLRNELTYDRFIPGYERTYLAVSRVAPPGQAPRHMMTSTAYAALFPHNFPEVEAATRLSFTFVSLRRGQIEANEFIYAADPNAFDLLPLPVFAGDLKTALARPDGLVITRSVARKYFGDDDALGEVIELLTQWNDSDVNLPMTVTAVIEDLPSNGTELASGIFVSGLAPFTEQAETGSGPPSPANFSRCHTYFRLAPNASIEVLQARMPEFLTKYFTAEFIASQNLAIEFLRLDEVHLFSSWDPAINSFLAMGAFVGILILFIAGSNFVNLSTARSSRRALEVGIRKVSGAKRRLLILQFLGEALVQVTIATIVAIVLAEFLIPHVNSMLQTGAVFDYWRDPALVASVVFGVLAVSVLAGLYPAFVLSAFMPANVLKGGIISLRNANALRLTLVSVQFAILIGLVIAATVVYGQREYAMQDALRLETDQMLVIRSKGEKACPQALLTELRAFPGIRGAFCGSFWANAIGFGQIRLKDGSMLPVTSHNVEPGLLELYGLAPLAGRFFTPAASQQESTAVINETAARRLGYPSPAAAIGQIYGTTNATTEIIGVVRDFSFSKGNEPADRPIPPTVYVNKPPGLYAISVKLAGRDIPETLAAIDRLWTATGGKGPINRIFVRDEIQFAYLAMLRQLQGFAAFSAIAVFLACLGLIGLSVSAAERRTKEIGIRKSMGASSGDILRMLTWDFVKPVLSANLIAWPVAFYAMNYWLNGFAYHIELQPWMFFAAGVLALFIALATVSAQSLMVARAKPVAALRYE